MVIDPDTNLMYRTSDDQIMNNTIYETMQNQYRSVVTEEMETTWQTELKNSNTGDNPKILTSKVVLYEGERYFHLNVKDVLDRYYVYSKGEIVAIYTDASDAVYEAENTSGTVTNKDCRYIYRNGDRKDKYTIDTIVTRKVNDNTAPQPDEEGEEGNEVPAEDEDVYVNPRETTVSVCLDEMLKTAGAYVDTVELLAEGKTSLDIMKESLSDAVPLALSGCSSDAMLYYVGNGAPVMALVENDMAVLITGFDENNLMIYDPLEGKIVKRGRRDASAWFALNGNRFLTYAK